LGGSPSQKKGEEKEFSPKSPATLKCENQSATGVQKFANFKGGKNHGEAKPRKREKKNLYRCLGRIKKIRPTGRGGKSKDSTKNGVGKGERIKMARKTGRLFCGRIDLAPCPL